MHLHFLLYFLLAFSSPKSRYLGRQIRHSEILVFGEIITLKGAMQLHEREEVMALR